MKFRLSLLLFSALFGVLALPPQAGAAGAAFSQTAAENAPPDSAKPPLSEEEIFPHILPAPKNKTAKDSAAAPAINPPRPAYDNSLSAVEKRRREENKLFSQLKHSADFKKAAEISRALEGLWAQSGSETVDLLMQWANKEIAAKHYAIALDFLDNAVALAPDYAEGWMRRASVHLMTNDIKLAMVEMQRVLQLEPRHYNAMLQLGAVMEMTKRPVLALRAYEKALEFYPQMQSAQKRVQTLIEADSSRAI